MTFHILTLYLQQTSCAMDITVLSHTTIPFLTQQSRHMVMRILDWVGHSQLFSTDINLSLNRTVALQWRHNAHDGVSNHQPHDCLLYHSFRRRSKKTSKLRVTGLCEGYLPVIGEFPAQRTSNAENVSIWYRHHEYNRNDNEINEETSNCCRYWLYMSIAFSLSLIIMAHGKPQIIFYVSKNQCKSFSQVVRIIPLYLAVGWSVLKLSLKPWWYLIKSV